MPRRSVRRGENLRARPTEFFIYVTARLGPHGQHYALAVGSRGHRRPFEGFTVVKKCVEIGEVLSREENRAAVKGEMELAREMYAGRTSPYAGDEPLVRRVLPEQQTPREKSYTTLFEADKDNKEVGEGEECRHRMSARRGDGPVEFPFIAACLLQALAHDDDDEPTTPGDVMLEPLGLTLGEDLHGYGMAVIDISSPFAPRHGIIAYWSNEVVPIEREPQFDFDFSHSESDFDDESIYPYGHQPPHEREDWSKVPLTAEEYCAKAGGTALAEVRDEPWRKTLSAWRDLDNVVLRYIWPKSYIGRHVTGYDNRKKMMEERSQAKEKTWREMVEETHTVDLFWEDELEMQLQKEPVEVLRNELEENPKKLGGCVSAGQLLALAYANEEALNWVSFRPSCEAITYALRQPTIQKTKTIALSVVGSKEKRELEGLLASLQGMAKLKVVCWLEDPKRDTDEAGMVMMEEMERWEGYEELCGRMKAVHAAKYSEALRSGRWESVKQGAGMVSSVDELIGTMVDLF